MHDAPLQTTATSDFLAASFLVAKILKADATAALATAKDQVLVRLIVDAVLTVTVMLAVISRIAAQVNTSRLSRRSPLCFLFFFLIEDCLLNFVSVRHDNLL